MEQTITSLLRFNNYYVKEFAFSRNDAFDADEVEITYEFSAEVAVSEDHDKANVTLGCTCFDQTFSAGSAPFYFNISLIGNFELQNSNGIEIDQFRVHSVAILLPYLRALVTSFTAQAGMPPVIIPPLNVYNMFKNMEELAK